LSPRSKETNFFDKFFSIGQGPSNAGKLNWNLLGFSSFIFILGQCAGKSKTPPTILNFLIVFGCNHSFYIKNLFVTYFLAEKWYNWGPPAGDAEA